MKKILIDSGPLIALFDRDDKYHAPSVKFVKNNACELVSTLASITEVLHLLDFNRQAQNDFLSWVRSGAITLEPIDVHDFAEIQALITQYSDLPMDFADACLVFLGNKLNIDQIATIDRDFDVYRLKGKKPFTVLIRVLGRYPF